MKSTDKDSGINNFVVFQELLFHSIVLDIQHTPRKISEIFRASWHVPKEKAIYCFIHHQLSLLPFVQKMELMKILQQLVLRTAIYHIRGLKADQPINLFLDLLNAELNATLGQQEKFKISIRPFNYGFVLLHSEKVYSKTEPSYEALSTWADWYYTGLKEFVYSFLKCSKTKQLEALFTLSFLQHYINKSEKSTELVQLYQSKQEDLSKEVTNTPIAQFIHLL